MAPPPPPRGPPDGGPRGRPPGEPGRPPGRRPTFEEKVAADMQYCRQRLQLLQERYKKREELLGELEAAKEEQAAKYARKCAAELAGQAARQGEGKQHERQQQQGQGPGATMRSAPLAALVVGLLFVAAVAAQKQSTRAADAITALPAFDGNLEGLYSGYLRVDEKRQRDLFYMLAEHTGGEEEPPLLLWTQGGPGCSPVGIGAFQELGPFFFGFQGLNVSELELERNPYSWTNAASMLFLDSPAFTGFSKSVDNVTDRIWDDTNTTADNLAALLAFYDRFPEYRNRTLFLAGESYSGHFIPLLAQAIVEYNKALPAGEAPIPLEGYAIGNAWSDPELDNTGAVEFWYASGFISRDTYEGLLKHCNFSATVLWRTEGESGVKGECAKFRDTARKEAQGYSLYGVNAPACKPGPDGKAAEQQPDWPSPPNPLFDPCASVRVGAWFNRQDVQEALHAIQPGEAARKWKECDARALTYSVDSLLTSMIPVHEEMVKEGVRVMVFSGDSDGVVPTLSSRSWVESLGLPVKQALRPWADSATGETAGYSTEYEGLHFATLHEAGHAAPYFQPRAALELISAFVSDKPLPEAETAA